MENAIIPHDYESWHHCITVECGIEITAKFLQERITSLQDESDFRTKQFVQLYGAQHRDNVISWLQQAERSFSST